MSFRSNETQQMNMNDSMRNLTERAKKIVMKSWAVPFANQVFPAINEDRFSCLYSDNPASRPNTPINVIIGALLIKENFQYSDEQMFEEMMVNPLIQYALHTSSCEEQPISECTFRRFRAKCAEYYEKTGIDLIHDEMVSIAAVFAKHMKVSSKLKRMDSLMVESSCKKMVRLELIYTCVRNMVERVKKENRIDLLDENLMTYLKESDKNDVCYRLDSSEVEPKIKSILADAFKLRDLCSGLFDKHKEFQLLMRMLSDQSKKDENGNDVLKPGKEVATDSLQNPSDEDATFRTKAGVKHKGYVGNIVETCSENGNLITEYDLQTNSYCDSTFATDTLKKLGDENKDDASDNKTEAMTADGGFGTTETLKAAEEAGIKLVVGSLTAGIPDTFAKDFVIDENEIKFCPAGHAPTDCTFDTKKNEYFAHFDVATCAACPFADRCKCKLQKKTAVVRLSLSLLIRIAFLLAMGNDLDHKALVNKRNGIEGVMSVLRRKYNVDHMPIRGLTRVRLWFGFKIGALNTRRLICAAQKLNKV
jgi:hypothetical protein